MTPGDSYIRGGGGVRVEGRRIALWVLGGVTVVLAAVLVLLAVDLGRSASRAGRLRSAGVPVTAVVTSCRGLASGTGITVTGFACRAAFVEGGTRYVEPLRGSAANHAPGDPVRAVVVPGRPDTLSAATWRGPGAGAYAAPAAVAVLLAAALVALVAVARRRPAPA